MVMLYNPVFRYINVGSYNIDVAGSVHVTILTILCVPYLNTGVKSDKTDALYTRTHLSTKPT